jgi:hypothetical protein
MNHPFYVFCWLRGGRCFYLAQLQGVQVHHTRSMYYEYEDSEEGSYKDLSCGAKQDSCQTRFVLCLHESASQRARGTAKGCGPYVGASRRLARNRRPHSGGYRGLRRRPTIADDMSRCMRVPAVRQLLVGDPAAKTPNRGIPRVKSVRTVGRGILPYTSTQLWKDLLTAMREHAESSSWVSSGLLNAPSE